MKYALLFTFCSLFSNIQAQNIFDAARNGDIESAKYMAAIKADTLSAVDAYGYTPLTLSSYYGQSAFVSYLLNNGVSVVWDNGESNALHGVCYKGFDEVAALLLKAGANPNLKDANGMYPLHYAAQFNHLEIVKLLLQFGADPLLKNEDGKTPIDYAKMLNYQDIVEVLAR